MTFEMWNYKKLVNVVIYWKEKNMEICKIV
jgi:hypothetical protein